MTDVITGLGPAWEGVVAARLEGARGLRVARRCADLAELLSVAAAGVGRCAIVSADLRGLDLTVVHRLRGLGLDVIGVVPSGDEAAERRLRQMAVALVIPVDAEPDQFAEVIASAVAPHPEATGRDGSARDTTGTEVARSVIADQPTGPDPGAAAARRQVVPAVRGTDTALDPLRALDAADEFDDPGPRSQVVAVWGPAGAPGRTTVAVTLAAEVASRGADVLLVDADTYGGSVAQVLGLLDEAPGVAAACRQADLGTLDLPALARLAPEATRGLRVLTGLPKAERWPEVRAAALERVLEHARALAEVVIVDCGFCLEDDEELSYDTMAPRRNEATLTALAAADVLLAVGGADPVALQRFVRGLQEVGTVPSPAPVPVINRVRASAVGSRPERRIGASLKRFAGLPTVHYLPEDRDVVDGALLAGRTVVEHAPVSALRQAVATLASDVVPSVARASSNGIPRRPARRRIGRRAS